MNKKGVFLTSVSILLVGVLIFYYATYNRPSDTDKTQSIEARVQAMDSFVSDIESDLGRGLTISSVRAFLGMMEHMAKNGTYIPNFPLSFQEAIFSGTINGESLNLTENSTLVDWAERIEVLAQEIDLNVNLTLTSVQAYQTSPWEVTVELDGVLNLTDKKGLASWNRELNITTQIGIEGLEDPLYSIATRGKLPNTITITNVSTFVIGEDGSGLVLHANQSWYIASSLAPSFLQRFEGDMTPSTEGIESIVNMEKLSASAPEAVQSGASSVDFMQFSSSDTGCLLNQTQELVWLRLDTAHLSVYGATCAT